MKGKAKVFAGICAFKAEITTEPLDEMGKVRAKMDTDCPNLLKLGSVLEFNSFDITRSGCNTEIFKKFDSTAPPMCCPCPVLTALYATAKIASGLALPKDIEITLSKEE